MLALENLIKTYGEITALDGCSFNVERGRLLGFLGPNGAGKTTTMRSIFGLVHLNSGQVTWDRQPITPLTRQRFGYMPEERGLYPKMKVGSQLTYLARLYGMPVDQAQASVDQWLDRLGLSGRVDSAVEDLSHGNQQRVQLAAALVHSPELMVLDEPFSGLDPIGVETMMEILREKVAQGASVLFSSHQLDLVEDLCQDVAIINEGKVVLTGGVEEIKDQAQFRRLEIQFFTHPPTTATELSGTPESDQWWEEMEGVLSHSRTDHRHQLLISAETDINQFLHRLSSTGRIGELSYSRPSLTDLFHQTVSA